MLCCFSFYIFTICHRHTSLSLWLFLFSGFGVFPAEYFHFLSLKLFVGLEEVGDFFQVMSVEFFYVGNVFDAVKTGIVGLDADDFVVLLAGVNHVEQADRPYSDDASGE